MATRIPFRAYNTDNQLIIHSAIVSLLKSIRIPCSVVAIGGNPFCGCHADLYNESKHFMLWPTD